MKMRLLFISASALFLGGIIYLLFYAYQPVVFSWLTSAGSVTWLNRVRQSTQTLNPAFPPWIVYSLPDGLWAFAYSLLITGLWTGKNSGIKYFWMSTIPVLILGMEILQYTGMLKGTFSFIDIAFEFSGLLIGIYAGIKITKSHHHEKIST
jgi:hypothetical protein